MGKKGKKGGSGDFSAGGLAKTELGNLIGECRVPDTSHISHRAFLRELRVLLSILLRILSVSANLMVGVGSGSKCFHALGVLARWVSETTISCLKGKVGACWGRGGRAPQDPQSTPLGWRGAVLGIPGKGGSSSHFWFWSFFPGFGLSVSPVELSHAP